jgi:hypothetical protein
MNEDKFAARNHCLTLTENSNGIIYKLRKYILHKFEIWDIWDILPYRWSLIYYDKIKPLFKPHNRRIRKAIPRQWCDISHLIIDVNFEFIKAFYEDEFKADIVDWNATEHHKEFSQWLEKTYAYITKERPILEIDMQNAYPPSKSIDEMFEPTTDEKGRKMFTMIDDGIPYEVKYAEVNRIEKLIDEKDTEVLTELVKRRDYFWT